MPQFVFQDARNRWVTSANDITHARQRCPSCTSITPLGPTAAANPGFNVVSSSSNFSLGGLAKGALGVLTSAIPGPIDDVIVNAAIDRFSRPQPPSSVPTTRNFGPVTGSGPCPGIAVLVNGRCVDPTAALPGGRPMITPVTPQAGMFGALSVEPVAVYSERLECPPGAVLGKDNRCYAKGTITNKQRKWPKAPKPPITRADMKAIRKAASARNRVKKLAGDVGFTTKKR